MEKNRDSPITMNFPERSGTAPAPIVSTPNSTMSVTEPTVSHTNYRQEIAENKKHRKVSETDCDFALISVAFKEAALDSPSFRATVNHLDTQVAQTEDWFMALTDSFMKVPGKVDDFGSVFAFLDYVVPSFLQDSLVDQEYCLATLYKSRETIKKLWAMAFSVFKINVSNIERKKVEFAQRAGRFRRLKRKFLACQEKYDRYYSIHMGTPKYKDAGLLYEDSLQLLGVRKEYLALSLDLVAETQKLTENINHTILSLNELFWRIKIENLEGGLLDQHQLDEIWGSIRRVRAWHDACERANGKLMGELQAAKSQIEDETVRFIHASSSSVDDYKPEIINSRLLSETNEDAVEKHGYLCVKTYSEKSSKPLWVKKWAFVKNGVLGFLALAPSLESVQETDKIGVLLCNVKYTPNEDRHFCFEVKTIDTTIVLQAETLNELKSWLKVFSNVRNRIINEADPLHVLLEVASSRYPPLVAEFSAALNTSIDRELTNTKTINSAGHIIHSKRLSKHLDRNEAFFEHFISDSITRLNLPIQTSTTKSALLSASLAETSPLFPSALEANISGSVNWALSAMPHIERGPSILDPLERSQTKQIGTGIIYPKNFPNTWMSRDLQMRALFEASVGRNEYCLFSYNCLLSPNESQELRATHFVTQECLYSYIHSLGFVSMQKMPLNRFVEATSTTSKSQDIVRLTLVHGHLILKVFIDDGMLVERKLNFLIQNLASDSPLGTLEIISELLTIERKYADENNDARGKKPDTGLPTHAELLNTGSQNEGSFFKSTSFDTVLPLMEKRVVNLPPKAVFHVLCGSESEILNYLNGMVEVQFSERKLWKKSPNGENYLIRDNESLFRLPSGQKGSLQVNQEVEIHVDNEFYSIRVTKSALKVTCGPCLSFLTRITIRKMEAERCEISFYGKPIIDGLPVYTFATQKLCRVFIHAFARHVIQEIDVATNIIGSKGKILKAVYFYGKILVSQEPYQPLQIEPVSIARFALLSISLQLIAGDAFRILITWCFAAINTLRLIFAKISMHSGLIGVIILLSISNMYLSGLNARQFWAARHSGNLVKELVDVEPMKVQRGIYLQDVQDLINGHVAMASDSACFRVFQNQSAVLNFRSFTNWSGMFETASISAKGQQLRERLNDIAVRRNDLLVTLKMLNHLEEEEALAEWRSWLLDEVATCSRISHSGVSKDSELNNSDLHTSMRLLGQYCDSCSRELAAVAGVI